MSVARCLGGAADADVACLGVKGGFCLYLSSLKDQFVIGGQTDAAALQLAAMVNVAGMNRHGFSPGDGAAVAQGAVLQGQLNLSGANQAAGRLQAARPYDGIHFGDEYSLLRAVGQGHGVGFRPDNVVLQALNLLRT